MRSYPWDSYAIVPAAGHGRRMGVQKLSLPWRDGTVIESVLNAWMSSRVTATIVVVRETEDELIRVCESVGATVLPASDPPDMKTSVRLGLSHVEQRFAPRDSDVWLLAPADMPRLSSELINRLLDEFRSVGNSILVPTTAGKRGHPVVFPWPFAARVFELGQNEGVNSLLRTNSYRTVDVDNLTILDDLDTPEDYRRLYDRHEL